MKITPDKVPSVYQIASNGFHLETLRALRVCVCDKYFLHLAHLILTATALTHNSTKYLFMPCRAASMAKWCDHEKATKEGSEKI